MKTIPNIKRILLLHRICPGAKNKNANKFSLAFLFFKSGEWNTPILKQRIHNLSSSAFKSEVNIEAPVFHFQFGLSPGLVKFYSRKLKSAFDLTVIKGAKRN